MAPHESRWTICYAPPGANFITVESFESEEEAQKRMEKYRERKSSKHRTLIPPKCASAKQTVH
jgi:hypothetical protein